MSETDLLQPLGMFEESVLILQRKKSQAYGAWPLLIFAVYIYACVLKIFYFPLWHTLIQQGRQCLYSVKILHSFWHVIDHQIELPGLSVQSLSLLVQISKLCLWSFSRSSAAASRVSTLLLPGEG